VDITRNKKGKKTGKRSAQASADRVEAAPGDFVRIVPIGASTAPDESLGPAVQLSARHKAPGLSLSGDGLSVTGSKGFRSVLGTHGFHAGTFYCEVAVAHLGTSGHCRLGWGTKTAEVAAPVGYDKHGYGFRDLEGSKVHAALREPYGAAFGEGDVIGMFLHLPPGGRPLEHPPGSDLVRYKGALWREQPRDEAPAPLAGAVVAFSVNGQPQGVAFRDVAEGTYYPMLSLFTLPEQGEGATLSLNPGPAFKHAPLAVEGCPPAEPLSALPARMRAAAEAEEAAAFGVGGEAAARAAAAAPAAAAPAPAAAAAAAAPAAASAVPPEAAAP
jgi:Set1/Ash2 histone methyltransferase complex subunit ASH2